MTRWLAGRQKLTLAQRWWQFSEVEPDGIDPRVENDRIEEVILCVAGCPGAGGIDSIGKDRRLGF